MSHTNLIVDADPHFSIDPITRRCKNESSKKVTLIQGDHNSERFTFELPRFIEQHDMLECDRVEVHFVNGDNASLYLVKDMQIHPEDETKVAFSWLVSDESTQNVGRLEFQIRFCCTNEDGVDDYIWNTAKNTDISISDGMNNAESVVERYPDIIAELIWKSKALGDIGNLETFDKTSLVNAINEVNADCDSRKQEFINLESMVYQHNDALHEMTKAPETEAPITLVPGMAYHLGSIGNLTLAFPSVANNGDVIYINFIGRETTNLVVDTTNTFDFDLVPENGTGYEIYAKYMLAEGVGKWIVKYSEYSGV